MLDGIVNAPSINEHIKFLNSLQLVAGIANHSLLYSEKEDDELAVSEIESQSDSQESYIDNEQEFLEEFIKRAN